MYLSMSAGLTHLECRLLAPIRSDQAHKGIHPRVSPQLHSYTCASGNHIRNAGTVLTLGRSWVPERMARSLPHKELQGKIHQQQPKLVEAEWAMRAKWEFLLKLYTV